MAPRWWRRRGAATGWRTLAASDPRIHPLVLDVTDRASLGAALDAAEGLAGPLTLLVNNAGVGQRRTHRRYAADEWRRVQDINVDAVWHLSRPSRSAASRARSQGAIINIASLVG